MKQKTEKTKDKIQVLTKVLKKYEQLSIKGEFSIK